MNSDKKFSDIFDDDFEVTYEEEPGAYQMVYRALDLADITGGRFRPE